VRVYLPPDANCLLSVMDHCLRSRTTSTSSSPASTRAAVADDGRRRQALHEGIGIWQWASNDQGASRTWSWPAAATCRRWRPGRRFHPARASARAEDPGRQRRRPDEAAAAHRASARLSDTDFDALFTKDKPVIFAFHGYPWLIHRLTYRRTNHDNIHVRGYKEEGTITTPST
jgi:xylulose-5-phosphate/fructose-6-phosphate phosphoketolase